MTIHSKEEGKELKPMQLTVDMIASVSEYFEIIKPENVDLEPFKSFEAKSLSVGNVLDRHQIEAFANDSKKTLTKCKNYASVVYAFYKEARRRAEKAEAKFALTEVEDLWSKKQAEYIAKDSNYKHKAMTESVRDSFKALDPVIEQARILEIKWDALHKWFEDTLRDLENSHNWYKKIFDVITGE